jgi:hypothetical protein
MLPGLRILFAITLLSVSVVIFGLGAAAFLRSAHEDVANAPWRPIETPATARVDLAPTTLAMLRVEPEATIADVVPKAEAAASAPPVETKPAEIAEPVTSSPHTSNPQQQPAAEQAPVLAAKPPEAPSAPVQADPPPAPSAATEPARDVTPPVEVKAAEAQAVETKTVETKALDAPTVDITPADAKAPERLEAQPGSAVVAALAPDNVEQPQPKGAIEPATASAAAEPVTEAPPAVEASPGADTLKADDKTIESVPAAKVAALPEPATAVVPPLPSTEVKIPAPRVDPSVIEARRKQQQHVAQQQRARARTAAKARRIAAARRAAAQAKAAAAATSNPFGAPANSTTNSIRAN